MLIFKFSFKEYLGIDVKSEDIYYDNRSLMILKVILICLKCSREKSDNPHLHIVSKLAYKIDMVHSY